MGLHTRTEGIGRKLHDGVREEFPILLFDRGTTGKGCHNRYRETGENKKARGAKNPLRGAYFHGESSGNRERPF